jgi:hypothetical protein
VDAKGADCLLEAFCLVKQGFKVSGQVSFPVLCSCSSPFFTEKKKTKKYDTDTPNTPLVTVCPV